MTRRTITGFSNPTVKFLRSLRDKKHRRRERRFLAEGLRLLTDAREAGKLPEMLVMATNRQPHPLLHALATDVADYLAKKGVPFREAHAAVGALVAQCEREGRTLADLTAEDYRAAHPAFEADVLDIDLDAALAARAATGGTAPEAVARERAAARARLESERAR